MSGQRPDLDSTVRSKFEVTDSFQLPEGEFEFKVKYKGDSKERFVELQSEADALGFSPELTQTGDDHILIMRKARPDSAPRSRIPVFLALLALMSIIVFSLLQQTLYEQLSPGAAGDIVFLATGVAIVGLLGVQELGRRVASRRGRAGESSPYLIPGIPFLPPFLPALGYIVSQRTAALNRDRLFDAMLAGPLVLLAASSALYALGDLTAVQSTVRLSASSLANSTVSINPGVIQVVIDMALGSALPAAAPGHVLLSPLGDAATVGFILVFFGLIPLVFFTGGHLAGLVWGHKGARAATYLSVLLLLVLDTPEYWALAVVVLVLAGRQSQLRLLDEVSSLSSGRKWLYAGALVLAALSVPIPHNIANVALG